MSKRPARFTEAEARRLAKVARAIGMTIAVRDGELKIVPMDEEKGVARTDTLGEKRRIVL
jgi:hypothetical protein